MFNKIHLSFIALSASLLVACGGSATPAASKPAAPAADVKAVTLEISAKGEEMAYDKTTLEVPAGARVTLKFNNPSTALPHNWVLTQPGQADAVAADGLTAGDGNGWLKPNDNRVIAVVKMLKPKEKGEVTFNAPAAGTYPYICTFPGHSTLMKGTLVVK
jgi:azurin